jgi:hypothetical protein
MGTLEARAPSDRTGTHSASPIPELPFHSRGAEDFLPIARIALEPRPKEARLP